MYELYLFLYEMDRMNSFCDADSRAVLDLEVNVSCKATQYKLRINHAKLNLGEKFRAF